MTNNWSAPRRLAVAGGLTAGSTAAVALHPRAMLPVLALAALLYAARLRLLAIGLLVALLIATLAGARVDATRPAVEPFRVAR